MKVMVVDDSPDYRMLVKREILREHPDAEFIEAADEDAFQRALAEPGIDIVVTDYQLHWSDGLRILRAVRRERPVVPVVMATDSGNEEIAVNGMKSGLSDYVLKRDLRRLPIAIEESIKKKQAEVRLAEAYSEMEQRVRERTAELEAANRELRGIMAVTESALSSLELGPLLETLLERLRQVIGADIAVALLVEEDALVFRAGAGIGEAEVGIDVVPFGEGFAGRIAQSEEYRYLADAADDPGVEGAWIHNAGIRAMLGVPMKRGDELIGVLHVDWLEPHPYEQEERRVLELTSERIASAITNAQLYSRTRRSEDLGEALNRINVAVTATMDADEMVRRALRKTTDAIGCESAVALLREDEGWTVNHVYRLARDLSGLRFGDADVPYAVRAGRRKRPLHVPDVAHGGMHDALAERIVARSTLVVPMFVREEARGVMYLNYHTTDLPFDEAARAFTEKVAYSLSLALENAHLYSAERDIADTLQEAVLLVPAAVPGLQVGHAYRSATEAARVGGDFYDVFELSDSHVGIVIGDVSGKGLKAATMTTLVRDTIRAYAYEELTPAEIVTRTNRIVLDSSLESTFVTLFVGLMDREADTLTYCNGGHVRPLHASAAGIVPLDPTGPLVGALPDMAFGQQTVAIQPGDVLFMYTDGMTEARRRGDMFGEERVVEALAANPDRRGADLVEAMLASVLAFTGGRLDDDLALLAVSLG